MNTDKVEFIAQLKGIEIGATPITELHANFFDLLYLGQLPKQSWDYALRSVMWLLSKVFWTAGFRQAGQEGLHLLVPAEPDKVRSMGMFSPVAESLGKQHHLIPLRDLLGGIRKRLFLKWLVNLPKLLSKTFRAFQQASNLAPELTSRKLQFVVDSLVHTLLLLHFRQQLKGFQSVLVDWDRSKFASLIVVAANQNQVATFTFIHGAIYTPSKFVPLLANYCLAWSNAQITYLQSMGVGPERLLVAGNPRFNESLPEVTALQQKYGLENAKVILYASQNFPDFKTEILIALILSVLATRPEWKLLVKPHPAERTEDIERYKNQYQQAIVLDASVEADESLALCDFVVLVSSTFSIDSLIKKKNILLYNPWSASKGIAHDLKEAGAVHFETADQFSALLDRIDHSEATIGEVLNAAGTATFLNDYCTYTGITAANKVTEALYNSDTTIRKNELF